MRLTHEQVRRLQDRNEELEATLGTLIEENDDLQGQVDYLGVLASAILAKTGGKIRLHNADLGDDNELFTLYDLETETVMVSTFLEGLETLVTEESTLDPVVEEEDREEFIGNEVLDSFEEHAEEPGPGDILEEEAEALEMEEE